MFAQTALSEMVATNAVNRSIIAMAVAPIECWSPSTPTLSRIESGAVMLSGTS